MLIDNLELEIINWFENCIGSPNSNQIEARKLFKKNIDFLVRSPTGSGKTLSAFLPIFEYLIENPKSQIIYISPLKALVNDMYKNLSKFVKQLNEWFDSKIEVSKRTGDSNRSERSNWGTIICTTPESLMIMLSTPQNMIKFAKTKVIVVDEVHAFANNKRGVQLAIAIARIKRLTSFRIIGLSATVSPIKDICEFLFNHNNYKIVDGKEIKKVEVSCVVPKIYSFYQLSESVNLMYGQILNTIRKEECTLIFTNTRSFAEELAHTLKSLDNKLRIATHHSSLSREERILVEQQLKQGELDTVVSATSMEQGIDIDCITKVINCFSPKQIAKATQRIGRAGHKLNEITKGLFFCITRDEAIETGVILDAIKNKLVDSIIIPKNSLDMAVQAVLSICFVESLTENEIYKFLTSVSSFKYLTLDDFKIIMDYLLALDRDEKSRKFFVRLGKAEESDKIIKYFSLRGQRRIEFLLNCGSIIASQDISVKCQKTIIGYLEEDAASQLKKNDLFALGGKIYQFLYSKGDTINCQLADFTKCIFPVWRSDNLPTSFDVANKVSIFRNSLIEFFNTDTSKNQILSFLQKFGYDSLATLEVYQHMLLYALWLKNNKINFDHCYNVLVEIIDLSSLNWENNIALNNDILEKNENKFGIILHSCLGQHMNELFAILLSKQIHQNLDISVKFLSNDNGITIITSEKNLSKLKIFFESNIKFDFNLEQILKEELSKTEIFKRFFKKNAYRSLAILQNKVNRTSNIPISILLNIIKKPNNLVYNETLNEIITLFNLKQLTIWLSQFNKFVITETNIASPLVSGVIFGSGRVTATSSSKFLDEVNSNIIKYTKSKFLKIKLNDNNIIFLEFGLILQINNKNHLIIGDLHLGLEYSLIKKYRFADIDSKIHYYQIQDILNIYEIYSIILLGDIKDSYNKAPSPEEIDDIKNFIDFLHSFCQKIFIIKGNHDGILEKYFNTKFIDQFIFNQEFEYNSQNSLICSKAIIIESFYLHHGHMKYNYDETIKTIINGHLHPAINLNNKLVKCSVLIQNDSINQIIIPAFTPLKIGNDISQNTIYNNATFFAYDENYGMISINNKSNDESNNK